MFKRYIPYFLVLLTGGLFSCEDNITVQLPTSDPVLIIDAWLDNKPMQVQQIRVQRSAPYFDQTLLPGVDNAVVTVQDITDNTTYQFVPGSETGEYEWTPTGQKPYFGEIGHEYKLTVQTDDGIYEAFSAMNRVPPIDSVTFRFEKGNSFFPDSYFASFYAVDPKGPGDTYWVKAWRNEYFLNKPREINISYDAGGSAGAVVDGITFIQPIRDGINPINQGDDNTFKSPYEPGDSVHVELFSINNDAYTFLNEVQIQTDRPGGFAELFAQPLANVSSNISPASDQNSDTPVVGFFNVSAVSIGSQWLDPDHLPTEQ